MVKGSLVWSSTYRVPLNIVFQKPHFLPGRGRLIPGELVTETTYPKWQSTEGVLRREEEMVCITCLFV